MNLKTLLNDKEPVPFYVLKLVNLLIEKNGLFVVIMKKMKIFPLILDFYTTDSKKLTKNTFFIL